MKLLILLALFACSLLTFLLLGKKKATPAPLVAQTNAATATATQQQHAVSVVAKTRDAFTPSKKYLAAYSPEGWNCYCPLSDENKSKECLAWNSGETLILNGRCDIKTGAKYVGGVFEFAKLIRRIAARNKELTDAQKTKNVILRMGWTALEIQEKLFACEDPATSMPVYYAQLQAAKKAAEETEINILGVYLFDEPVWRLRLSGSVNKTKQDRFVESLQCQVNLVRSVLPRVHVLVNFAGPLVLNDAGFRANVHQVMTQVAGITHVGFDHYPSSSALSKWEGMKKFWAEWIFVYTFMQQVCRTYAVEMFIIPLMPTLALKPFLASVSLLSEQGSQVQLLVFHKMMYNLSMLEDNVRYVLPWMQVYDKSKPFSMQDSSVMKHLLAWKECVEQHDYTRLPICPFTCSMTDFTVFNVPFKPTINICNQYKTDARHLDEGCAMKWDRQTQSFVPSKDSTCCVPIS